MGSQWILNKYTAKARFTSDIVDFSMISDDVGQSSGAMIVFCQKLLSIICN